MQVGDLVRLKKPMNGLCDMNGDGVPKAGEYLIYIGDGYWAGWGRFIDSKGQTGQMQFTDVEAV